MKNRGQRDFTQGSIPRHIILFSLPMFAGSILQALYSTVDSIWVGRFLGPNALGAVSISFPLIMALLSLVMGLTMSTSILVAQYRGARNEEMVHRTVATSLILLGILGGILSVIGVVFRYPLIGLLSAPPEIMEQATAYFGIFMAGVLGMFVYNVLTAILRGLGDAKTPLYYLAIATVTNIILDPLMIFGFGPFPKMGVGGAALATIISQGLSSYLLWGWVAKHTDLLPTKRSEWRMEMDLVKKIVRIGLPSGLQQVLVSFGMVAVMSIISSFGSEVIAAFGAASRLDQFGFMPAMVVGMGITSMVGQNLGAGQYDRVRGFVRWSAIIAVGTTALITLVAVFRPTILIRLFTDDPSVLAIGSEYLRIMGPSYISFALIFVLSGVVRGSGDTIPPMIFAIVALWLARVPLAYILSRSMGTKGIWLGIALSSVLAMLLNWGYYLTGRWMKKAIARGPMGAKEPVLDLE